MIELGVKVDVVTGTDSRESTRTVTKRIITNIVLNIVPEVANGFVLDNGIVVTLLFIASIREPALVVIGYWFNVCVDTSSLTR